MSLYTVHIKCPCSLDKQFFIGLGPKVTSGILMDFPLKVTPNFPTAAEFWFIALSCKMTYRDLWSPFRKQKFYFNDIGAKVTSILLMSFKLYLVFLQWLPLVT